MKPHGPAGSPPEYRGEPGADPPAEADLLAAVLDQLDVALAAADPQGRIVHWNHAAELLLGWPAAAAVGRPYIEVGIRPADRPLAEALRRPLTDGLPWSGELPFRTANGERLLALCRSTALHDPEGRDLGLLTTFADAEELSRLEQSRRLLDAVFLDAPVGIAIMDTELRMVRANPALEILLGGHGNGDGDGAGNGAGNGAGDWYADRSLPDLLGTETDGSALLRNVLDTGVPLVDVEVWPKARSGREGPPRRLLASCYRLHRPSGLGRVPVGLACFLTRPRLGRRAKGAAISAQAQLNLLRQLDRVSAECADPLEVLRVAVGLAHPDFADQVILDIPGPGDELLRLGTATGPAPGEAHLAVPAGHAVGYPTGHPVRQALRTGRTVAIEAARCVPVRARGRLLGVASFIRRENARRFEGADTHFADLLSARIGEALDASRLLGRIAAF